MVTTGTTQPAVLGSDAPRRTPERGPARRIYRAGAPRPPGRADRAARVRPGGSAIAPAGGPLRPGGRRRSREGRRAVARTAAVHGPRRRPGGGRHLLRDNLHLGRPPHRRRAGRSPRRRPPRGRLGITGLAAAPDDRRMRGRTLVCRPGRAPRPSHRRPPPRPPLGLRRSSGRPVPLLRRPPPPDAQ